MINDRNINIITDADNQKIVLINDALKVNGHDGLAITVNKIRRRK